MKRKREISVAIKSQKLSKLELERLNNLFNSISPKELRQNLLEVYHTYLIYVHDALPVDFRKISMNMYLLIQTLDWLDDAQKSKINH